MKNLFRISGALVFVIFFAACSKPEPVTYQEAEATPVQVLRTEFSEVVPLIKSFGSVSYVRKADISASVESRLAEKYVQEGESVENGQLLARLENIQLEIRKSQAEAAVTSARANVRLAEERYHDGKRGVESQFISLVKSDIELTQKKREVDNLARIYDDKLLLYEVDGISKEALENARLQHQAAQSMVEAMEQDIAIKMIGLRNRDLLDRGFRIPGDETERKELLIELNTLTLQAEVEVAQARLASAQKELVSAAELLKELELRSPLDGIVGTIYVEPGERVENGTKVFTLFQSGDMYVVFPVQEEQIVDIRRGMKVEVLIDTFPGKTFSGAVSIISPIVDPESGNISIKAILENGRWTLRPGMFARITIHTGKAEKRILLPSSAFVQSDNENGTVLVIQGDRVFRRALQIGPEKDGRIEILNGLNEGEEIVVNPSPLLREGALVDAGN